MSDDTTTSRQKIRTFAKDLESARQRRSDSPKARTEPQEEIVKRQPETEPPAPTRPKEEEPPKTETEVAWEPTPKPAPAKEPVREPAPKEEVSRPIPAFHELQKRVDSIQKANQPEPKHENITAPTEPKRPKHIKQVARPNIGYDATVIRDTKSDRFKLIPSVIASIKAWFAELKKSSKRKESPKYAVSETNRRKGVIQKATSKTGALFAADNDRIKERIKQRKEQEILEPVPVEHEPEMTWSPYTDTGYPLLEAPEEKPADVTKHVTIEFKRPIAPPAISTPVPQVPAAALTEQEEEIPTIEMGTEVERDEESDSMDIPDLDEERWAASRENTRRSDVTETKSSFVTPPPAVETSNEVPDESPEQDDSDTLRKDIRTDERWIYQFDTNTLTIGLLLVVISVLFAVFVVRIIVMNTDRTETNTTLNMTRSETEAVMPGASVSEVTISGETLGRLPELVQNASENAPVGLVELAIVSPLGDEVSPSYLFELLRFRTVANLRQSVTTMRFVTVNRSEPSVLMQFVDEETVRGGLLDWEANLPTDMRALYSIPAEFEGRFVDDVIEGNDVRILRNDGEVILVYGFVGRSSLLIAASNSDFAQIADLGFAR